MFIPYTLAQNTHIYLKPHNTKISLRFQQFSGLPGELSRDQEGGHQEGGHVLNIHYSLSQLFDQEGGHVLNIHYSLSQLFSNLS